MTSQRSFFPALFSTGIAVVAVMTLLLVVAEPSRAEETCESLVNGKCLSCHFETRICQKMKKKKGKRSWKRTIKGMVRHGTELSREQQKTLVQCFSGRDAAVLALCGLDK